MVRKVISFDYTLTDKSGKVIDASKGRGPLTFMEGAQQIIPGLEKHLISMKVGDKQKIEVPANEAYGERNDQAIVKVKPEQLPNKDVKIGDMFRGGPDAHAPVFVVKEVTAHEITLDGNHPLAGEDLTFDVQITAIRDANEQELQHGHAHGEHGHSH
jgi:FKBP-type peptidyl-prolyl cis-trans isomerase SlyD